MPRVEAPPLEKPKTPVKLVGAETFSPNGVRAQHYLDALGQLWICSTDDDFHFLWRRVERASPGEVEKLIVTLKKEVRR